MNLNIRIDKSKESIQKKGQFVWNWRTRTHYIGAMYFFIAGVTFLYFGITSDFTFKVVPVKDHSTIYNLHIGITIGTALLIVALILFTSLQIDQKNFLFEFNRSIRRNAQDEVFITVNEANITYSDLMMRQEIKWDKFTGFVYKKGYLMLLTGKRTPSLFIVHKNEVNEDEFQFLLDIVRTKLRHVN